MRFRPACLGALFGLLFYYPAPAQTPASESFFYGAAWRFLRAGEVELKWTGGRQSDLSLRTVGLVSTLVKVNDRYTASFDPGYCALTLFLDSQEGRRHRQTRVTYDRETKRVSYLEQDVTHNKVLLAKEMDIPSCVHEVTGALQKLREAKPEPGTTTELPISDGKKVISARIDALERETVKTPAGTFSCIRYEAFLMNDVLYRRKGRLLVWLTDDDKRCPVQIKLQLPFYIGTVTLQAEKIQRQ
jgi:hypothetical protein